MAAIRKAKYVRTTKRLHGIGARLGIVRAHGRRRKWVDRTFEGVWDLWQGEWNGAGWDDDDHQPGPTMGADPLGGWEVDMRCLYVRVFFSGRGEGNPETLEFHMEDYNGVTYNDIFAGDVTSGQIVTPVWRGGKGDTDFDLDNIYFYGDADEYFTIDRVEFYDRV